MANTFARSNSVTVGNGDVALLQPRRSDGVRSPTSPSKATPSWSPTSATTRSPCSTPTHSPCAAAWSRASPSPSPSATTAPTRPCPRPVRRRRRRRHRQRRGRRGLPAVLQRDGDGRQPRRQARLRGPRRRRRRRRRRHRHHRRARRHHLRREWRRRHHRRAARRRRRPPTLRRRLGLRSSRLLVVDVETARVRRTLEIGAPIRGLELGLDSTAYVLTSDIADGGVLYVVDLVANAITAPCESALRRRSWRSAPTAPVPSSSTTTTSHVV